MTMDEFIKNAAGRIRAAAARQLDEASPKETTVIKTAAIKRRRRDRVVEQLVLLDSELDKAGDLRPALERGLADEFSVQPGDFRKILKEASVEALSDIGIYWMKFFAEVGV